MMYGRETRVEFSNEHGRYIIEVAKDNMTLQEVIDELIKPILHAAGYDHENIEDAFD